jgi:hypothetical protein
MPPEPKGPAMINQLLFLHQLAAMQFRDADAGPDRIDARARLLRSATQIDLWRANAGLPRLKRPVALSAGSAAAE